MFFGDKRRQEVSEDEIRTMVSDNEELDDEEKRMIHEVMDLGDATAEEVMTPRVDMIMVGSDETVRQAIDRMRGTGYSRLPVFRDDDDDIIGIVRYKDLIDPLLEDKEDDLAADYVAEVGFVPESKSLLPLLNEMQTNRQQMVIVVDEYGGTAGLITIEDIVEEIVGEIVDETDFEDADIKALGAGSWCVKGSCPTDDAAEAGFPVKAKSRVRIPSSINRWRKTGRIFCVHHTRKCRCERQKPARPASQTLDRQNAPRCAQKDNQGRHRTRCRPRFSNQRP